MFNPRLVEWETCFGGEKWEQIAKAGLMKGNVSDCVFIDHCVDLSHNNGIYFDKVTGIFFLDNKDLYQLFLYKKRYCKPQSLICFEQGYMLNRLMRRASNLDIVKEKNMDIHYSPICDEMESSLLSYRPIQWGDKRLDCSEINVLEQDDFYASRRRETTYDEHCQLTLDAA